MTDVNLFRPYADDNMQAWENFNVCCFVYFHTLVVGCFHTSSSNSPSTILFFSWFDLVSSPFDLSIKGDRTLENVTIKQSAQIDFAATSLARLAKG